ncbi:MAG: amidohydrolase family protein, partial [Candidatus Dormibacteraceae bacterium]
MVRMGAFKTLFVTVVVTAGMLAAILKFSRDSLAKQAAAARVNSQSALLQGFAEIHPIDTHTHVYHDDPAFNAFLKRWNLHLVDICVLDDRDPFFKALEPQVRGVLEVIHGSGGHASLCTTFSPYSFEDPGFAQQAIRQLNKNFAEGAVAVKIYKTIGMEIKTKSGKYLLPDDPVFEPIYK